MSLRLRLIIAFFVLSVVPLGAVTFYAYISNARALREAASHEAESLAGELTQRMELVTTQLSDRVEDLMNMPQAPAVAVRTTGEPAPSVPAAPTKATPAAAANPPASAQAAGLDSVAEALGEVSMLLNNIEVRGMRGRGGRAGVPEEPLPPPASSVTPPPTSAPAAPSPPGPPSAAPQPSAPPAAGQPLPPASGAVESATAPPPEAPGARAGLQDRGRRRNGNRGPRGQGPEPGAGIVPLPPVPALPPTPPPGAPEGEDRLTFDMMPIRRELIQQLVGSSEEWQRLTPEERQKIIGEVNQRMLGIVQGIQLGTAEAQKKVSEAQQAADAKAREAARAAAAESRAARSAAAPQPGTPAAASPASTTQTRRRTALSGSRLDVRVERNGQIVREANAEVNLPNLLATVFTSTRRERGEVPFAVAKDGHLYTPTAAERRQLETIGDAAVNPDTPPGTTVLPAWIVVTTADPTGSGLKFGIARPVGESLRELRRASARNAALGLGCIGLALIGIVPLASGLTRHLTALSVGVRRIAQGDYSARVPVASGDEVGRLARAFNQMAEDIEKNQRALVGQERIRRELELGRQIQSDMLPRGPLRLGRTEIMGVAVPAREIGGDFFNYFVLPDGQLALLVGDVSGKGVGAAIMMANLQASIRTRFTLGQHLADIAHEIDVDIERNTPGPLYATLFIGMLDPDARILQYVNAGHNPPYILRADRTLEKLHASGLPVGLLPGRGYSEASVQLAAGDLLFFYTDGCVEAENEAGEVFGAERLEALLLASADTPDLLERVAAEEKAFRGSNEPADDATMMVVRMG
jgi:serine phosphatase RsbU (regulator of sigma subunit)